MKINIFRYKIVILTIVCGITSCKKYLDIKSDARLSTPSTLGDLQAILDNTQINWTSYMGNIGADEYYIGYDELISTHQLNAEAYVWNPKAGAISDNNDWKDGYIRIFNANTVLDNLQKMEANQKQEAWNSIKGSALFFRAFNFFQLAQIYAPQYDPSTAAEDLGIPLKLVSNFNVPTTRPTVQETYDQIINDLLETVSLLKNDAGFKTRPSRPAAHALLARVYLQMGNYTKALEHADSCLKLYNSLIDYNDVPDILVPFERFNKEVILYAIEWGSPNAYYDYRPIIDSLLYKSYEENDLRKTLFFEDINGDGAFRFTGNYNGSLELDGLFTGLATDEVYLIRAECYARTNKLTEAIADLNTLLQKRWKQGTFVPFVADDADDALRLILSERKKELVYRTLRWNDLRRLNKDERFAITLRRELNGQTYTLPPNDLRYTFLIPADVINLTNVPQNPR